MIAVHIYHQIDSTHKLQRQSPQDHMSPIVSWTCADTPAKASCALVVSWSTEVERDLPPDMRPLDCCDSKGGGSAPSLFFGPDFALFFFNECATPTVAILTLSP